jgi:mono/diheme cytochrome c family protein
MVIPFLTAFFSMRLCDSNNSKHLKMIRKKKTLVIVFFFSVLVLQLLYSFRKDDATFAAQDCVVVDQGPNWTPADRNDFYIQDQGSQLLTYSWLLALNDVNGQPFLQSSLERYGFLPIPGRKLPVGFSLVKNKSNILQAGLTCAGCHTRNLKVGDAYYRVDGAPSFVNLEQFTTDLDEALQRMVDNPTELARFYDRVVDQSRQLGEPAPPSFEGFKTNLVSSQQVKHEIVSRAFPVSNVWGVGRVDALNQIYNRLAGLDLAVPPQVIVRQCIVPANIPVRPPFLWNSFKQDYTQWTTTSANGNIYQALMRNSGQVIGVGGMLNPVANPASPNGIDFFSNNSINWKGIEYLETLIRKMGPPRWPWNVNAALAAKGQILYNANCNSCHGIKSGEARPPSTEPTWATPLHHVGTDPTYYNMLTRTAPTGILKEVLGNVAPINTILDYVTSSMVQQKYPDAILIKSGRNPLPVPGSFESRVLQGVWASAPYLHNGSVPTLEDLLKPAAQRPETFSVGVNFDTLKVGLSSNQKARFGHLFNTKSVGNSNAGHEYGTQLTTQERSALLEYLKIL